MARLFEGKLCPRCGKGTLRGTIKKKNKVLLRCDNHRCKAIYQLKERKFFPEQEFERENEIPIVPEGVFMGFAMNIVSLIAEFGAENITSRYFKVHAEKTNSDHPALEVSWWEKGIDDIPVDVQRDLGIEPIRKVVYLSEDPLWLNYGISAELTKVVDNSELVTIQKIMGVKR